MKLNLICGVSGSGKSSFLYESVCREAAADPNGKYIIIVPEQFTLETQREIVMKQKNHVIMNIDVLSFMRLAFRVFEELGLQELPLLDDMGKNMVLRHVLAECKKPLPFFGGDIKKLGFLSELKSLISEFEQYGIGDEGLLEMIQAAEDRPLLAGKLKDMRTVREEFLTYKENKFLTAEEILPRLTGCVTRSFMVRESVICFDGFTGFTPVQLNLLRELFPVVKEIRVAVTIDGRENRYGGGNDFELFSMSKKMIKRLQETAQEAGAGCNILFAGDGGVPYRFRDVPDLAHLEHSIFQYPQKIYPEKPEHIFLNCAKDREEEAAYVLLKIQELVREKGMRYRDIAVITGDMEGYAPIFSTALKKACIPFFMDYKKKILSNVYVELIRSFLALFEKNWSYEAVFRHIGNGLLPFTHEEKDLLENYVLAAGIRGRARWKQEWTRGGTEELAEKLSQLNQLRLRFIELFDPVLPYFSRKKKTVMDFVMAIYEYSHVLGCEEKLWEMEDQFLSEGNHSAQREYAQVYKKVMELFERMAELLGDETVNLREFEELFDAGVAEVKIGLIPPGLDQLIIGDLERTRLNHVKALFFIGLNDGIVPKAGKKGGIISDIEREFLSDKNIEMAPAQRELACRSQYYLYLALTKPEQELYLSYSCVGSGGEALRPSYLLHKIQSVFPELKVDLGKNKDKGLSERVAAQLMADRGKTYLVQGLRVYAGWEKMPPLWKEVFLYYAQEKPKEIMDFIDCALGANGMARLPETTARLLYGKDLYGGVTRFEQYAACEYAHFLAYGLELKERREFVLRSLDIGNVFHEALRLFGQKASSFEGGWHGLYQQEEMIRHAVVMESLSEVLENGTVRGAKELLDDNSRSRHLLSRIKKMLIRTADILLYQMYSGTMEPSGYELNFKNLPDTVYTLKDGRHIHLKGIIDRMDQAEYHGQNYVRVVDYKTGKQEFSLVDIYYGLQLQLIIYLKAGMQAFNADAAGTYYYRIDDPFVEKRMVLEDDFQELLRLNGISSTEPGALYSQDKGLVENGMLFPGKKSDVIPFAVTKKGEPTAATRAANQEKLQNLLDYVQGKVQEFGEGILEGRIARNPYQKTPDDTACQYCNYREMCSPNDPAQAGSMRSLGKNQVPEDIGEWEVLE